MKPFRRLAAPPLAALILAASGFAGSAAFADEPTPEPAPVVEITDEIDTQAFPGCALGYACLWKSSNYGGSWAAAPANGPFSVGTAAVRDTHNSAGANGKSCKYTRFWNNKNNRYFSLKSESWDGSAASRDANLANGAGIGPYKAENWTNRVKGAEFHTGTNCK